MACNESDFSTSSSDCKLDFGLGIYARLVIVFHDQVSSYDEDVMSISQGVVSHNLDDLVNDVNSLY